MASVTVAGRTTLTSATDMTLVVDNPRREFHRMRHTPRRSCLHADSFKTFMYTYTYTYTYPLCIQSVDAAVTNFAGAVSAEPVNLRTATTSFSRRALAPMSSSLSSLPRHSRARSRPQQQVHCHHSYCHAPTVQLLLVLQTAQPDALCIV